MQPATGSRPANGRPSLPLLWLSGGLWLTYSLLVLGWLDLVSARSLLLCVIK